MIHIVYGNGDIYSGDWLDAPRHRDVQVVIFQDPVNDGSWTLRHGGAGGSKCDFFRLDDDGSVVGMDLAGMIDYVVNDLGLIKQGKMLSTMDWQQRLRQAMEFRNKLRKG